MAFFKCKGLKLDPIFGDGILGNAELSTETWYAATEDTGVIEKCYKSLYIPSGVTITAGNRNSGIIIRCQGDCSIDGTITNLLSPKSHNVDLSHYYPSWMIDNGTGGNGASGGKCGNSGGGANGGAGQTGRYYGGGYSGGGGGGTSEYGWSSGWRNRLGGVGGSATGITTETSMFVGGGYEGAGSYGGGGGGAYPYSSSSGSTLHTSEHPGTGGSGAGGAGGYGQYYVTSKRNYDAGGGGGAGNIGGGVVILYVAGNLTVNGSILCNGSNGGERGSAHSSIYFGGAGGGAGGGRIYIVYKKEIDLSSATLNVNGGTGANAGGTGTKHKIEYRDYNKGAGVPTAL